MKHKIIQTDNYLLIVSDEEIKVSDWCIMFDSVGNIFSNPQQYTNPETQHLNKGLKKIIAHLPLNNSPILEGVDLLPPLEDDNEVWKQGLKVELNKLPYTKHLDDGQYNDGQLAGFEFGATWGYNKAKERFKYIEEDILLAMDIGFELGKNFDEDNPNIGLEWLIYQKDHFIQSLQQPKYPIAFECEMEVYMYSINGDIVKPKTTTNSNGQTVWVGKYLF